ncbi:DUF3152 domain-containing protein [Modestobacter muralis]|uniref:DUF3152 domain-containing protein n=1 Tax=Modestobacter muralis TaxID=1608614 RepID=A0A6P0EXN7_9ACTN|nr:DUF3152 domain-containing protein [Modestobacter muralis]NEN52683.1 DUF3152 domain-containing protein [Modestobacter muralis]
MTSSGPRADRGAGQRPGPGPRPADGAGRQPWTPSPGDRRWDDPVVRGPLVARRDPVRPAPAPVRRGPAGPAGSRLRRFVRRHGWRAYALPFLVVATVIALVDVVGTRGGDPGAAAPAAAPTAAASPSAGPGTSAEAPVPDAEGEGSPSALPPPAPAGYVEQGAGTVSVVDGSSAVLGTGPLERFVVEVEDGIGVDGAEFAEAVTATLGDGRSWGAGGRLSVQRVGAAEAASGDYDFRVSLVSPGSMEVYCPGVGTGGYTSCRYGERAVINLARWETAVPDYDGDIATYRQYVVNHEVGHALGNDHEQCPGPGQLAPVMQQQTLGLQGCAKNAWPYPQG